MKEQRGVRPSGETGSAESNKDQSRGRQEGSDRNEGTAVHLTSDSTLQTPEEHAHDQQVDPGKDDKMDVSDTDLEDIKAGRVTGRTPRSAGSEDEE